MRVRLLFFAVLRDITGKSGTDIEVAPGTRAADIWQTLRSNHPELASYERPPMVAINEAYADPGSLLDEGDELAFIPPVAGG